MSVCRLVFRSSEQYLDLDLLRVGDELLDLGLGLFEGLGGDVGHEDVGALLGEQDGCLKANAAGSSGVSNTHRRVADGTHTQRHQ